MEQVSKNLISRSLGRQGRLCDLCEALHKIHNHPTGDLEPSQSDIDLTNKLVKGAKLLEIEVYEHLIISTKDYISFVGGGCCLLLR